MRNNRRKLGGLLVLPLALASLGAAPYPRSPGPDAVAIVDGKRISVEQFAADLADAAFLAKNQSVVWRFSILNRRIEQMLLEAEARRLGYAEREWTAVATRRLRRQYGADRVWREAAAAVDRGLAPERVAAEAGELPQLLDLTVLVLDSVAEAREAEGRIGGGASLEEAGAAMEVKVASRKGYVLQGGMYTPEVDAAIAALRIGESTPAVETPMGFLVVRLDGRRDPTAEQVAEYRESVAAKIRGREIEAELVRLEREVRAKTAPRVLLERWPEAGLPEPEADDRQIWEGLNAIRIAEVGGAALRLSDLFRNSQDYRLLLTRTPEGRQRVFEDLREEKIREALLSESARARGLDRDPEIERRIEQSLERTLPLELVRDIQESVTLGKLPPSTCRTFYDQRRESYPTPAVFELSEILVRRKEEAEGLMQRLNAGADFAGLARKHSVGEAAARGGDLGRVTAADLVPRWPKEMADDLARLAAEGRFGPLTLRSTAGYHVIVIRHFLPAGAGTYEDVRAAVERDCLEHERDLAVKKRISELRAVAVIGIDEEKVATVQLPAGTRGGYHGSSSAPPPSTPGGGSPHGGGGR